MNRLVRRGVVIALLAIPGMLALAGPQFATSGGPRSTAFDPAAGPFGSDFAGRDVLDQLLLGGAPIVITSVGATVLCYVLAVPLALTAAATRRRWLDELIMRPFDVVLAMPSLLVLILLASIAPQHDLVLIGIVVVVLAPDATRVIRAAALGPANGPAAEAMLLAGEPRWRRVGWFLGRSAMGMIMADAGVRFVGALYLVASASFLGVGVEPDRSNWGVMVEQNRDGLLLQPLATLLPACLITALAVGLNLAMDEWRLRARTEGATR
ncbi:ABC transporter permease subunit [Occultella aeris]|uniref:Putative D,D-dipeptide transport system permease protein DdpC n=1 Tax=Occultella aeris TaxID=2761496 RepID=A0A7M4DIB0_9MICO|nr:ABC transporter permease subunit [Occultella aeris]VZO36680.1 putative D,D-dipeptide transport system permease protein DdpC [Occultella aeris]